MKKKLIKTKYYKINFKVASSKMQLINDYCKDNKITKVKLIRMAIDLFLVNNGYKNKNINDCVKVPKNQMSIFDIVDDIIN